MIVIIFECSDIIYLAEKATMTDILYLDMQFVDISDLFLPSKLTQSLTEPALNFQI